MKVSSVVGIPGSEDHVEDDDIDATSRHSPGRPVMSSGFLTTAAAADRRMSVDPGMEMSNL